MKWGRRILVLLVALPLLAFIGLLLAGQREGAGRNVERVAIARPPALVFLYLQDPALLKKWTRLVETRPLTGEWMQPGSRFRAVVEEPRGGRAEYDVAVTATEKDRYLALLVSSVPGASTAFTQVVEYRLEARGGDTRLVAVRETHYGSFVPRLLEPVITRALQRDLETALARLREFVEATPPGRLD